MRTDRNGEPDRKGTPDRQRKNACFAEEAFRGYGRASLRLRKRLFRKPEEALWEVRKGSSASQESLYRKTITIIP